MAELLVLLAVVLVIAGWCLTFSARYGGNISTWRRVLSFAALACLSASVIELLGGTLLLQDADPNRRFFLIPRMALIGFGFTSLSFITGWFGHWRAVLCILPATLIVGFLWFIAVIAL